jgi:tetratricopeptide (TPR) repeat protein
MICLLLWLAGAFSSFAAKESWLQLESPHFLVLSNAGEKASVKTARQFEQFHAALARLLQISRESAISPVRVILFDSSASFFPYQPRYRNKTKETGGYFLHRPDGNYIVITRESRGRDPLGVIYHEYVHCYLHNRVAYLPLWFSEGLAEYFSTFKIFEAKGTEIIGQPLARHLQRLRGSALIPLRTLLTVDRASPVYNESDKVGMFYAESWLLVHYLMLGEEGRYRPKLIRFLRNLESEIPVEENFKREFGVDFAKMEKAVSFYANRFLFPSETAQNREKGEIQDVAARPVPLAELQGMLGDLFYQINRLEAAEKSLLSSLALDPNLALSRICLAQLRIRQNRLEEALDLLEAAVAEAPAVPRALANYAYALSLQGEWKKAAELYLKTIPLQPGWARLYAEFAGVQTELGMAQEAEDSLRRAAALNPGDFSFFAGRSFDYLRYGRGSLAVFSAGNYLKQLFWNSEHSLYMAIVEHFGARMAGQPDRSSTILEKALKATDPERWPYPVIQFLSRKIGEKELLALARDKDQQTEARTYLALDLILGGTPTPALPHLTWVREKGNRDFEEYFLAMALLDRLQPGTASPAVSRPLAEKHEQKADHP